MGQRGDYRISQVERQRFDPLAQRAAKLGIRCKVVVGQGEELAAEQILTLAREQRIDRIVIGTHTPGPVGKLL